MVLLGVEPSMYHGVLAAPGIREALAGKVLVSILGGVTVEALRQSLYGAPTSHGTETQKHCHIVRCIPNTAAAVRQSMTIIFDSEQPVPSSVMERLESIFLRVGRVKQMPVSLASVAGSLAGSTAAFFSLVLGGIGDGAVRLGIDRADSTDIAAAAMAGAAAMIFSGESPDEVRRKITTPGGSTAAGLEFLQESKVASCQKV